MLLITSITLQNSNYAGSTTHDLDFAYAGEASKILRKQTTRARKYKPSYLKYDFTYTGEESTPIPLCVICNETLSNLPMKPSLMIRHFQWKHDNLILEHPAESFRLQVPLKHTHL